MGAIEARRTLETGCALLPGNAGVIERRQSIEIALIQLNGLDRWSEARSWSRQQKHLPAAAAVVVIDTFYAEQITDSSDTPGWHWCLQRMLGLYTHIRLIYTVDRALPCDESSKV